MRKPAFSRARTARWWGIPGILGTRFGGDLHFPEELLPGKLSGDGEILEDGVLDIGERFRFGVALRPTTGQTGAGDTEAFLSWYEGNRVFHGLTIAADRGGGTDNQVGG